MIKVHRQEPALDDHHKVLAANWPRDDLAFLAQTRLLTLQMERTEHSQVRAEFKIFKQTLKEISIGTYIAVEDAIQEKMLRDLEDD